MPLHAGTHMGRYEIRSHIGAGGMGEVYLAWDPELHRAVALKVIAADVASNQQRMSRFIQEARTASSLNHPNILTIHEIGQQGSTRFIATEFIDGITLRERMRGARLGISEVLEVAAQVASALDAAHQAGVVHRDIKPENVMLRRDGYVKVLDFGLAKLMNKSTGWQSADSQIETQAKVSTTPGVVMGTVMYMSPEQARGQEVDARTDIWSLGVVLYEMLSGRLPFEGETASDVIASILKTEPIGLTGFTTEIPVELERIVMKSLRKQREERYQIVRDMALDLRGLKQRREFERSLTHEESRQRIDASLRSVRSDAAQSAATIIETASLLSKERHPNNLSEELTPLAGREEETAAIVRLLGRDDVRLMTLTGVGGTGKTRLAEHVARVVIQEFEDGVFFIDLAPVSNPLLVASSIAQPLGVQEVGGKPLADTLKDFLRERRMLLILDNFEQVTAAATVVKELLSATHWLKMLVTSRVPLHLLAEHEFNVPPLEFPAAQELPATDELMQYAAITLFVERAQAVKPAFALTDGNAKAVAEICTRLDGLPLAIKLAAARVKFLQPQAMLARLENQLKLLTGGARDLPARQQTMRSAISWSYDLLGDEERKLLNRLSVFAGGSTLEAAEKVCGASEDLQLEMLDAIASLVDKSLLVQKEQADGESRYRMLEVVREYAQEQLEESGEADDVQRRHAEFFRSLAERAEPELTGPRQAEWYERLEEEHDNLRAALQWSGTHDAEGALRITGAIGLFWNTHGHYTEGRRWYEEALRRGGDKSASLRAKALTGAGSLAWQQGDYPSARKFYEEGLQLGKEAGDKRRVAVASRGLGAFFFEQGDLKRARTFFEESMAIRRELDDKRLISAGISMLGELERIEGNFEAARALYEEALALGRQTDDKQNVCSNLLNLGAVSYQEGTFEAARTSFAEALRIAQELGKKSYITLSLDGFAALALQQGEMNRAAQLAGAAEALRDKIGYELETPDRLFRESYLGALRAAINPTDLTIAYKHGCTMKMKQAVAFALESFAAPDTHWK